MLGLRLQSSAARQLADPMRALEVRLGMLWGPPRWHCHPNTPFVNTRSTFWPRLDLRRSRIDELLWRRKVRAVGVHRHRPLDAEAGTLCQEPPDWIDVRIDPAV